MLSIALQKTIQLNEKQVKKLSLINSKDPKKKI